MSLFRRNKKKATSKPPPPQTPNSNVSVVADDRGGVSSPSSPQPTKVLCDLIYNEKWDEASRRCRDHPLEARWKDDYGNLPIHRACIVGAPLSIIRCLHEAYGEGFRTAADTGRLPIHLACEYGASLEVIRYLHGLHPDGATEKTNYGDTPADCLKSNDKLSEEDKAAARAILAGPPRARTPPPRPTNPVPAGTATTTKSHPVSSTTTRPSTSATPATAATSSVRTNPQGSPSSPVDHGGDDAFDDDEHTKSNAAAVAVHDAATTASRGSLHSHHTPSSPTTSTWPSTSPPDGGDAATVEGEGANSGAGSDVRKGPGDVVGRDAARALTTQQHRAIQALTRNLHDFDRSLEGVRGLPTSLSGSPEHVRRYFRSFVAAFERTYVAAQALSTGAVKGQLMDRDMLVAALENIGSGVEACGVPFAGAISIFASLALHQMQTHQENLLGVFQQFFAGDSHMSHVLVCRSAAEQICLRSDLSDFSGRDGTRVRRLRAKVQRAMKRLEEKLQKCHLWAIGNLEPIEVKVMDDLAIITEAVMTMWFKSRDEYIALKDAKDEFRVQLTLDALGLDEVSPITYPSTSNADTAQGGTTSMGDPPMKMVDVPIRGDAVSQIARPQTSRQMVLSPPDKVKELEEEVLRLKKQVAKLNPTDDDETIDVGSGNNQSQAMCFVSRHSKERKRADATAAHEYNRRVDTMHCDIQGVREIVHTLSLETFMTRRVLSVIEARKFVQQVLMCSKGDCTGRNQEGLHHHKSVSADEKGRFRLNGKSYRIGYVEGRLGPSKKLWDGKSEIRFDLDSYGARSVKYWFLETGLEHRYNAHGKEVIRHMFAKELLN